MLNPQVLAGALAGQLTGAAPGASKHPWHTGVEHHGHDPHSHDHHSHDHLGAGTGPHAASVAGLGPVWQPGLPPSPELGAVHFLLRRLSVEFENLVTENNRLRDLLRDPPLSDRPLSGRRKAGLLRQSPGLSSSKILGSPYGPVSSVAVDGNGHNGCNSGGAVPQQGGHEPHDSAYHPVPEGLRTRSPVPHGRYENLKVEFELTCNPGSNSISVENVLDMRAQLDKAAPLSDEDFEAECTLMQDCLATYNHFIHAPSVAGHPAREILLDTFVQLLYDGKDRVRIVEFIDDEKVVQTLREIRRVLIGTLTANQVAEATGTIVQQAKKASLGERILNVADPLLGVLVLINAICIGVQTDYTDSWDGWIWLEGTFTACFLLELVLNLGVRGFVYMFCSDHAAWYIFDSFLVGLSAMDFLSSFFVKKMETRTLTVVRLCRFVRFTKLTRVLRLKIFKEITILVNGLVTGTRTLISTSICVLVLLYMLGIALTQSIGGEDNKLCEDVHSEDCAPKLQALEPHREDMFGSVARSMFTVFRCYTDGCTTPSGTPLAPLIWAAYGPMGLTAYVGVTVITIFGLFNLIAAMFVQNTWETSIENERRIREAQEAWKVQMATDITDIIVAFCRNDDEAVARAYKHPVREALEFFTGFFSSATAEKSKGPVSVDVSAEITREMFEVALTRPAVKKILFALEISQSDPKSLFDALDADGSGRLEVSELVRGLMKLRGGEKQELVALLLKCESVRSSVKFVEESVAQHDQALSEVLEKLDVVMQTMEGVFGPLGQGVSSRHG